MQWHATKVPSWSFLVDMLNHIDTRTDENYIFKTRFLNEVTNINLFPSMNIKVPVFASCFNVVNMDTASNV